MRALRLLQSRRLHAVLLALLAAGGIAGILLHISPGGHRPPGGLLGLITGRPRINLPRANITTRSLPRVVRYENALWFDGSRFVAGSRVSIDGVFGVETPEVVVDTLIDLHRRYVIPPFAEAHSHHLSDGAPAAEQSAQYLAAGIYYVKVLNNTVRLTAEAKRVVNRLTTVEVAYANGGITSVGGHPSQVYAALARRKLLEGMAETELDGNAYFAIESDSALRTRWPLILAGRPDFIKVYISSTGSLSNGGGGLDPRLVPQVVDLAHRAGLPVTAHVKTRADFLDAIDRGVDEIAHLPLEALTKADAELAAARQIVVVTTTVSHQSNAGREIDDIHRENLSVLEAAGVRISFGTDNFDQTVIDEVNNIRRLGVIADSEIIRIWTDVTARSVFPRRMIGKLQPGYEASFLVLDANPLVDFAATRKIAFRIRRGAVIEVR